MPVIIIDKNDINRHPDLKEELKLIAESVDEVDGTFIYKTIPQKVTILIVKLNKYRIAFDLKHS